MSRKGYISVLSEIPLPPPANVALSAAVVGQKNDFGRNDGQNRFEAGQRYFKVKTQIYLGTDRESGKSPLPEICKNAESKVLEIYFKSFFFKQLVQILKCNLIKSKEESYDETDF